jgi:hypothetical protein
VRIAPLYIYGILRPMESVSSSRPPILQHRDCETVWQRMWIAIKRLLLTVVMVSCSMVVSACQKDAENPNRRDSDMSCVWRDVSNFSSICAFELEDGTRCVALDGVEKAGIDCDFPRREP